MFVKLPDGAVADVSRLLASPTSLPTKGVSLALPRPSDPILSLLVEPPPSVSRVRAIARFMLDDVVDLARHLRKDTGD